MTSPTTGQGFVPGSNLTLAAAVIGFTQRTVVKVEFFRDNIKLGEDFTAPYNFLWSNVQQGTYALRAVATDNLGGVWSSPFTYIIGINAGSNTGGNTGNNVANTRGNSAQTVNTFALSPNPTSDLVIVKTTILEEGNYDFTIFDGMGRVVLSKQKVYEKGIYEEMIDLSEFYKGIYVVRLFNKIGQSFYIQKLIVH